ncbi:MAG: TIGR00282 family metallophosphoesterase [Oscillospiraceae bacterium]|nr:TIGR00282 family metallophosphoesterase [Oscillospiraceae bacterium]
MKIIALGDVVGKAGRTSLSAVLPALKSKYSPDLVIVNGENSSSVNGISRNSLADLYNCGADVVTTGNHAFKHRDIYSEFEKDQGLIRPANFHPSSSGKGYYLFERKANRALVVNLLGAAFLDPYENPFETMEKILSQNDCKIVIVDFHGEATAEKISFARHFDGRISLVFGTHTHVQTADETIFPGGTGYITDLGMCGPIDSVIGVKTELAVKKMMTKLPVVFENADGPCKINGIFAVIDDKTAKCLSVERIAVEK